MREYFTPASVPAKNTVTYSAQTPKEKLRGKGKGRFRKGDIWINITATPVLRTWDGKQWKPIAPGKKS